MKKVVLLGDSIRMIGYGLKVPELLGDEYEVWQPEDNCRFARYMLHLLYVHKKEIENADIIHWNNGKWDATDLFGNGPVTPVEHYVYYMKEIAKILKTYGKKVIFATTTYVNPNAQYDKNENIERFNNAIVPELEKMGIIIDDLNSVVAPNIDEYVRKDDNIHLSEKGIDACAKHVAEFIKSIEI